MIEQGENILSEKELKTKEKTDLLLEKVKEAKQVLAILAKQIDTDMLISGYPPSHWRQKFKITIPSDGLNPGILKGLDVKLLELNQEAAFFQAIAQARMQLIKRGVDSTYYAAYASVVEEYKAKGGRLPAASTLETIAKIENSSLNSASTLAEIEFRFWKDILDHLSTCRKLVENASLNISVEMKALNQERMIDNLGTKYN